MTEQAHTASPETRQLLRLCQAWKQRSEYLGYKGKKRDDAAIDFFAGAASLAEANGNEALLKRLTVWMHMVLAVRGDLAVRHLEVQLAEECR